MPQSGILRWNMVNIIMPSNIILFNCNDTLEWSVVTFRDIIYMISLCTKLKCMMPGIDKVSWFDITENNTNLNLIIQSINMNKKSFVQVYHKIFAFWEM